MKKFLAASASLLAFAPLSVANASDLPTKTPAGFVCDPYKNYSCLDDYLGDNPVIRFFRYYQLEWGKDGPPTDPKAPPGRRADWPTAPQSTPPMPFNEWPYGGTTNMGVTRPNSVDSPLMVAIANTALGKAMDAAHIQVYGWVQPGGNISNMTTRPGGNAPAAYDYTPNTVQLDQAVVYIERLPDTVQKENVDWGFRISGLYGVDYRYTTAYGVFSNQLLFANQVNGYDMPMVYGEVFIPQVLEGLMFRVGRFISLPDIEAQLAPNNYMYTHSLTYTFDNYTNTGIQSTLAINKNWIFQLGVTVGTEAAPWHWGATVPNPFPNSAYPGTTMPKDPGATPSVTVAIRYTTDDGKDNVYLTADSINKGNWGYNNLQWWGLTYYHKFNDEWHISIESYYLYQRNVLNITDPLGIVANNGYPFSPLNMPFNAPNLAQCADPNVVVCNAGAVALLSYLNYSPNKLNNYSLRTEFYDDMQGQRTGTKTRYVDVGLGWQHWFSPQIEARPEVSFYRSLDAPAFNGNSNAGIAPNKSNALIASGDIIIHF
ncbi:MAG TPA: outer membrane beta-barrel protein [Xanthobacteraceae bacterium]|nr:outer membrane beta-barrel protein [Xanthobacteraceae bacterium]